MGINEFWVRRISTVSGKDAVTMVEPLFEPPRSDGHNLPDRCETGGPWRSPAAVAPGDISRGDISPGDPRLWKFVMV